MHGQRRFEPSNSTPRRGVDDRRLDGGHFLVYRISGGFHETPDPLRVSAFLHGQRRFEPSNSTPRWGVDDRRLDGGHSLVYRISGGFPKTPDTLRVSAFLHTQRRFEPFNSTPRRGVDDRRLDYRYISRNTSLIIVKLHSSTAFRNRFQYDSRVPDRMLDRIQKL